MVKVLITRCIQCGCLMEPGSAQCGYAYTPDTPMRERTWDVPGIWYAVHSMISAPCFDAAPRTERGRMEWPKDPDAIIEEVELKDGWLFAHEPVEEPETVNDIIERDEAAGDGIPPDLERFMREGESEEEFRERTKRRLFDLESMREGRIPMSPNEEDEWKALKDSELWLRK